MPEGRSRESRGRRGRRGCCSGGIWPFWLWVQKHSVPEAMKITQKYVTTNGDTRKGGGVDEGFDLAGQSVPGKGESNRMCDVSRI